MFVVKRNHSRQVYDLSKVEAAVRKAFLATQERRTSMGYDAEGVLLTISDTSPLAAGFSTPLAGAAAGADLSGNTGGLRHKSSRSSAEDPSGVVENWPFPAPSLYNDIRRVVSEVDSHVTNDMNIEEIQNWVERVLMEKYPDVAKHYILYREERAKRRRLQQKYKQDLIPWGNIGYPVFRRTYSRVQADGTQEEMPDTIGRAMRACNTQLGCGFDEAQQERFTYLLLHLKGMLAGRQLWQFGTPTVTKYGIASTQNCAFTLINEPIKPFSWTFDMLMLGCGVGFSIQKQHVDKLPPLVPRKITITRKDTNDADFIVPDSREGWVSLLERVLYEYFYGKRGFTYSTMLIRKKGEPIKSFGGVASGPEHLCEGIQSICKVMDGRQGQQLRPIDCLDIVCIIASVVVSGNVRRSATICIGDSDDKEYLRAKRWDLGNIPSWRAMSNNSVVCSNIDDLPDEFWDGYTGNGEPYGLINLDLARRVGRLADGDQYPDPKVEGFNPCLTADTMILTDTGPKAIADLMGRPFVAMVNGTPHPSTKDGFYRTGMRPVFELAFANGATVKATDNHRFLAPEGWITVRDMKVGATEICFPDMIAAAAYRTSITMGNATRLVSCTALPGLVEVYDCTIPDGHMFLANGLVSHNCAEQPLANKETCCLAELFLPNLTSLEEMKEMASYLYRVCKHSLLLPCHHEETEAIVHSQMRMGIGVSGYLQATAEQQSWLDPLYKFLREYDATYSDAHGMPRSVKLTTIKPSGTLSLLAGVTPGWHPALYRHYIRRVRMSAGNPLIEVCRKHGYRTEYQQKNTAEGGVEDDLTTIIVEFPDKAPDCAKLAADMTAVDELDVVKHLQTVYSDNGVSATIYYRMEELPAIQDWLRKNYTNSVKAISFLLHSGHGFRQAPYEEITKERYEELMARCIPITSCDGNLESDDTSGECRSGACPIK